MYKVTKLELLQAEITPGNSICLSSVKIDCVQFQHALTTQPCYLPNELYFLLENVSRKVKKRPLFTNGRLIYRDGGIFRNCDCSPLVGSKNLRFPAKTVSFPALFTVFRADKEWIKTEIPLHGMSHIFLLTVSCFV